MQTTPADTAPQRIDLGDMVLVKTGDDLVLEHIKLAEPQPIDLHLLVNWLRRQLREVF